jgi:GntR family transcriptional regulator, histidine utilization repressor
VRSKANIASLAPIHAIGQSDRTLHNNILDDIKRKVLSGEWPPGSRIPIETDLAVTYSCSRMTVNKALMQLVREGLIERRKKVGSFVRAPRSQSALLEIGDIQDDVEALGLTYTFERLSRSVRPCTASERRQLGLASRSTVLAVTCVHSASSTPYCYEDRVINLEAVPAAADQTFIDAAPGRWLVASVPWTEAEHRIRAVNPDQSLADALAISTGEACLVVERLTRRAGQTITHVTFTYPGRARELVASFRPSQR